MQAPTPTPLHIFLFISMHFYQDPLRAFLCIFVHIRIGIPACINFYISFYEMHFYVF